MDEIKFTLFFFFNILFYSEICPTMDVKRCFMWTLIVTFYCYFTTAMQEKVVWKVQKLLYHIKHHRPILQLCIKDWTHGSSVLWNAGEAVGVVWSLQYSVHRNNPALTKCAQKCCYCYCHWSTALLPQLLPKHSPWTLLLSETNRACFELTSDVSAQTTASVSKERDGWPRRGSGGHELLLKY